MTSTPASPMTMDEIRQSRRLRHCEHYSGRDLLMADTLVCKAAVDIMALIGGDRFGWFKRSPCYEGNEPTCSCNKRQLPSWEVMLERQREMDRKVEQVIAIHGLIPKTGTSGEVDCPTCGNKLDWARSSYNGHVHGKCRTDNCLSWME